MRVLMAAAELTPLAKVGGLADVVGALPLVLKKYVDARVILPKYQTMEKYPCQVLIKKIPLDFKGKKEFFNLYQSFLPKSKVILYLIDHPQYFKTIYSTPEEEIKRFLFFTKAISVLLSSKKLKWHPQIIHLHDWHVGFLPLLLKISKEKIKILFTVHNLAMQGIWNRMETLDMLGLNENDHPSLKIFNKKGDFNFLEQGILNSDLINTVSQTYVKEILTKKLGQGLEKILKKRKKDLYGILNGIDIDRFNPKTDPFIKTNYSFKDKEKKEENKLELQKIAKLEINPYLPLIGFVSRLTKQKGIDLIIKILNKLNKLNLQMIFLGNGDPQFEKILKEKKNKRIVSFIKFDAKLAQNIYAGADILMVPSFFEPCGLTQMIAMRYGTVPLVRATGGLKDTVSRKEGFIFYRHRADELLKTIKLALKIYQNKKQWNVLQKNCMKKDFSWDNSAKQYLKLYQKLI